MTSLNILQAECPEYLRSVTSSLPANVYHQRKAADASIDRHESQSYDSLEGEHRYPVANDPERVSDHQSETDKDAETISCELCTERIPSSLLLEHQVGLLYLQKCSLHYLKGFVC